MSDQGRTKKPDECECCGYGTRRLRFYASRDARANGDPTFVREDTPWTMRPHWLCRLCETGLGFEIHQGRVNHGIAQALNVILEAVERRRG